MTWIDLPSRKVIADIPATDADWGSYVADRIQLFSQDTLQSQRTVLLSTKVDSAFRAHSIFADDRQDRILVVGSGLKGSAIYFFPLSKP